MKAILAIALPLAVLTSFGGAAADPAAISIEHAWLRAMPKGAPVVGGYATIVNKVTTPDRLVGATLSVAAKGEIHSMTMEGATMHMAKLDALPVAAGATVTLMPGGYHLMFLNPTRQLKDGETVEGTLVFEKAGTLKIVFAVAGPAAKTAPAPMPGMAHKPGMKM